MNKCSTLAFEMLIKLHDIDQQKAQVIEVILMQLNPKSGSNVTLN